MAPFLYSNRAGMDSVSAASVSAGVSRRMAAASSSIAAPVGWSPAGSTNSPAASRYPSPASASQGPLEGSGGGSLVTRARASIESRSWPSIRLNSITSVPK